MLLRLREFFTRVYPREELMQDVRWLLLAFGAFGLQIGFSKALFSLNSGIPFVAASALLILFGILPFFWFRVAAISLLTAGLVADLVIRHYFFSIIIIWVCFIHAFHLFRSVKDVPEPPQEGAANES